MSVKSADYMLLNASKAFYNLLAINEWNTAYEFEDHQSIGKFTKTRIWLEPCQECLPLPITMFDLLILNCCASLLLEQSLNKKQFDNNGREIVNCVGVNDFLRLLSSKRLTNAYVDDFTDKLHTSMHKLSRTILHMMWQEYDACSGELLNEEYYNNYLLGFVKNIHINKKTQKTIITYQLYKQSILYNYADNVNALVSPRKTMMRHHTDEINETFFLLKHELASHVLYHDSIKSAQIHLLFNEQDLSEIGDKKTKILTPIIDIKQGCDFIDKILSSWKECGFIINYKFLKNKSDIVGVSIQIGKSNVLSTISSMRKKIHEKTPKSPIERIASSLEIIIANKQDND